MEKIKYIFLILSVINILSCLNCNIQDKLEDISTYVCTHPDSARKELNKINKSELTTEALRAHHALLTCESNYFSRREIKDSILDIASKNFINLKKGTISQQMETRLLQLFATINYEPEKVLPELLLMEKDIDNLSSPHFKRC